MLTLDEIGLKHKTDKASRHHHYLDFYELLFEPWRYKRLRILEIGIQFGLSLKTWREYFVHAHIIGLDSIDNDVHFKTEDGVLLGIWDAYTPESVSRIESRFDIIIDDGSHEPQHQKFVVEHYLPMLTDEGVLIIEDILKPETIPFLAKSLPDNFNYVGVEMTQGDSIVDSRLFVTWRKHSSVFYK